MYLKDEDYNYLSKALFKRLDSDKDGVLKKNDFFQIYTTHDLISKIKTDSHSKNNLIDFKSDLRQALLRGQLSR